jgi:hypothetical protein
MNNAIFLLPFLSLMLFNATLHAQSSEMPAQSADYAAQPALFDSDEILDIRLSGELSKLMSNRTGPAKKFPLMLFCKQADSIECTMPVVVRTRGHFRRLKENCTYPPLLIQFTENGPPSNTIFREQKKMKLVMPCRGDEYVVKEWLVYKLYNLFTPGSFRARLVRVTLEDSNKNKKGEPFFGLLLEEEWQMARRNKMMPVKRKMKPEQVHRTTFFRMAVFQYLIGNTDWSVQYQQNIKLMVTDSTALPVSVPYDFDHSGIVNAPYAQPAPELQMKSIRERRYRGYCIRNMKVYEDVFVQYRQLKAEIYQLYTGCPLLDEKYKKQTIQFLDEFYTAIDNPEVWQRDFSYPCDPNGTGNVVIKGLKED